VKMIAFEEIFEVMFDLVLIWETTQD